MSSRLLWSVAVVCAVAVIAASFAWIHTNPLPSYWDEAVYAKAAILDAWETRTNGVRGFAHAFYDLDPLRPPMMRVAALPFTLLFGADLTLLRAISLTFLVATALLLAMAARRVAGDEAGVLAFVLFIASPIVVHSTKMFGTEYPLFFALALTLWALTTRRWIVLGIAIGIGLLAKLSYAFVAAPLLIAAVIVEREWRRDIAKAIPIGMVIAATWWLHDPMTALRGGLGAGGFSRHSLGGLRYFVETVRCDFGVLVAIAIVAAFIIRGKPRPFAIVCLAGALPLMAMHFAGRNQNPRLIAPSVLLLCAAAAVSAQRRFIPIMIAAAAAQVVLMTMPRTQPELPYIWRGVTEVMAPVEQWDWTRLRAFADSRGMPRPRIAILGEGYAFNTAQIRYAWFRVLRDTQVRSIYDAYKEKQFDPSRAADAQIVVTAPGYHGDASDGQTPNNAYNDAFAAALANDPRFKPYVLDAGVRHLARVAVFVRQ